MIPHKYAPGRFLALLEFLMVSPNQGYLQGLIGSIW